MLSDYWGLGYATETSALLIDFAKQQMERNRVVAKCDPDNHKSMRVLQKLGMRRADAPREVVTTWRGPRERIWFALDT